MLSSGCIQDKVVSSKGLQKHVTFSHVRLHIGAIGTKSEPVNDDAIWKLVNKWNELFLKSSIHNNK